MNCFDKFHCGLDLQRLPRPSFFFPFFFCFCCSTSFFFLFIDLFLLPNIWPINTDMQMKAESVKRLKRGSFHGNPQQLTLIYNSTFVFDFRLCVCLHMRIQASMCTRMHERAIMILCLGILREGKHFTFKAVKKLQFHFILNVCLILVFAGI